jgi:hypothetical protein
MLRATTGVWVVCAEESDANSNHAKRPAEPAFVWVSHGRGRTRPSGGLLVCVVLAPAVDHALASRQGACRICGVDRGWSLRSTPGYPLGPRPGSVVARGGGAAGVLRPKGPAVLPARPSGPGTTDHNRCRPNGPTVPLDARAVRGTVGPLGRTGWGWPPPGPPTLAGRTAGPLGRMTDHSDVEGADVKGDRDIVPPPGGILTVLRSCVPSKRSRTQFTRRGVSP